jgi:hypothetical protein
VLELKCDIPICVGEFVGIQQTPQRTEWCQKKDIKSKLSNDVGWVFNNGYNWTCGELSCSMLEVGESSEGGSPIVNFLIFSHSLHGSEPAWPAHSVL